MSLINNSNTAKRIKLIYTLLVIAGGIFIIRLFFLEVIKYSYYQQAALSDQLKEYQIPADRGLIEAFSGNQITPIVVNQTLYTLFADPTFIKQPQKVANDISNIIGGNASNYESLLKTPNTEYVVIAQKLSTTQSNAINKLNIPGLGTRAAEYRDYPDGSLASQLLGFVDSNGNGQYGIEQALNSVLAGKPGQVKAITDANGVPLVGNKSNVLINPKPGSNVILTINLGVQQEIENMLPKILKIKHSNGGSVVVMNISNGNVVAMANYPTYNPANYASVTNPSVFQNAAADNALEPGSVMKTMTVSTALNIGAISGPNETFYDPGSWTIDGFTITDIAQDSGVDRGTITVASILVNSLNTGATWMLMQMGGGQINEKARTTWYNYMVNHFHLGKPTGIQQGYEASGYVPGPNSGYATDLTYANTSFGQGVTLTPLQLAAADSAILNGGTYYQPNLVYGIQNPNTGQISKQAPIIWKRGIVKPSVAPQLASIMEDVVNSNWWFYSMTRPQAGYIIGGKTGTAQIALPGGGYSPTEFNGTFTGFVGIKKPQYVIVTEVNDPHIPENSIDTYAGAGAAAPIFGQVVDILINGGYVTS